MFRLLLILSLSNVIHVQPNYWKGGYSKMPRSGVKPYNPVANPYRLGVIPHNPYYGWKKPARQMNVYSHAKQPDWFYDMDDDWEVSNRLTSINPYYSWYKKASKQMDLYGPAKHVGKINRGQFLNPELNTPADRAFGYQSDFNPQDYSHSSGAFKYKPRGQKYRATAVHVNKGLASYVGEVRTMAIGQHVQEDGTILLQTPYREDPCQPNPCTGVRMSTCTAVNSFTAKCSGSESCKLTLTWYSNGGENDLDLLVYPAHRDGSLCFDFDRGDPILAEGGGGIYSGDAVADDGIVGEESVTLTTTTSDTGHTTTFQDHTYAAVVLTDFSDNLSVSGPVLKVSRDGVVKQTLATPQYKPAGVNVNYDEHYAYFFGCFRPEYGYVDTRGAGFYFTPDAEVFAGVALNEPGLCKALLGWTDGPGFNPYDQSGSGDESATE